MDVRERAADALYREQADRLWRAVFAFTGDRELTSDAVAEAFAQCLGRGEAIRSPGAWLWRAAFQIARGELQRRNRDAGGPTGPGASLASGAAGPPDRLLGGRGVEPAYEVPEPAWELIAALRSLPERQRAVLVLHYYAGYPTGEIARTLGASAATVRVHLSRGRRRLRELLEEDDDG